MLEELLIYTLLAMFTIIALTILTFCIRKVKDNAK